LIATDFGRILNAPRRDAGSRLASEAIHNVGAVWASHRNVEMCAVTHGRRIFSHACLDGPGSFPNAGKSRRRSTRCRDGERLVGHAAAILRHGVRGAQNDKRKQRNESEDGVPHVLFPFNVRLRGQPIAPAPTARTGLIRASIRRLARLAISRQIR